MNDTTSSSPSSVLSPLSELTKLYVQQFGALTFGVCTLLIVWYLVVSPQLDRNAQDTKNQQNLIEQLHKMNDDQKEISSHLKVTAEILDRVILKLDKSG